MIRNAVPSRYPPVITWMLYPDEGVFGFDTEGRRFYATGGFHVDR